jgi:hypothetical protein
MAFLGLATMFSVLALVASALSMRRVTDMPMSHIGFHGSMTSSTPTGLRS